MKSQLCVQASQYDRCSSNSSCACFHLAADSDVGICADQYVDCSKLQPCESSNNKCSKSQHVCVRHPRCSDLPVCYPLSNRNLQLCPPISSKRRSNNRYALRLSFHSFSNKFLPSWKFSFRQLIVCADNEKPCKIRSKRRVSSLETRVCCSYAKTYTDGLNVDSFFKCDCVRWIDVRTINIKISSHGKYFTSDCVSVM